MKKIWLLNACLCQSCDPTAVTRCVREHTSARVGQLHHWTGWGEEGEGRPFRVKGKGGNKQTSKLNVVWRRRRDGNGETARCVCWYKHTHGYPKDIYQDSLISLLKSRIQDVCEVSMKFCITLPTQTNISHVIGEYIYIWKYICNTYGINSSPSSPYTYTPDPSHASPVIMFKLVALFSKGKLIRQINRNYPYDRWLTLEHVINLSNRFKDNNNCSVLRSHQKKRDGQLFRFFLGYKRVKRARCKDECLTLKTNT